MPGQNYQDVRFVNRHRQWVMVSAVATFEPQDGSIPYRREIATLRCRTGATDLFLGSCLQFCDRQWVAYDLLVRPTRGWATVKAAFLAPEPSSNAFEGRPVKLFRPAHVPGLAATTEDADTDLAGNAVISHLPVRMDAYEAARQTAGKVAIYVARELGRQIEPNWAINDGETRYRVDSVHHVDRLDVLPYAACTVTGARV